MKVDLARYCRDVKDHLGWGIETMAVSMAVSERTISYWLKGERNPSPTHIGMMRHLAPSVLMVRIKDER